MDSTKQAELDALIGQVDRDRTYEKLQQRDRLIQERRHLHQFRDLKQTVLRPALRHFMVKLDATGNPARLRDMGPNKLRLDFMIEATKKAAGLVEFELPETSNGLVRVSCLRDLCPIMEESVELDELTENVVADVLIRFLKKVL